MSIVEEMRLHWLIFAIAASARAAGSPLDIALAVRTLSEWARVCDADGKLLWGKSMCGPMILVDPGTRAAISNRPDPDGKFRKQQDLYFGSLPDAFVPSNTSFEWGGQQWSNVLLPLPTEPFARMSLVAHESFHRIQGSLGLDARDTAAAHLDTEAGRLWLRLELRALARALREGTAAGRQSASDAMLFRMYRHSLCPGSDELEAAMEKQEGLAEYTGDFIALRSTGEDIGRVARTVEAHEEDNAFARGFAYATGPALGLLLDRYAPGWRPRAGATPLDAMLIAALQVHAPADLPHAATERGALYGYSAVAAAEREREERHQATLKDLTARFLEGPTLDFPAAPEMNRNFSPLTLVPFPPNGVYYPTGTFSANWGRLRVESGGGALVAPDNRSVRVSAPADPNARPVRGEGWTLELAPGWTIQPATRPGSFAVVRGR